MIVPLSKGVGTTLYNYGFSKSSVKPIYNFFDINSCLKLSKERIPIDYCGVFKNSFVFIIRYHFNYPITIFNITNS